MTYPVDDAGNPRVDFVWGNMAMQPNDQRAGRNLNNRVMNNDWLVSGTVGSDALSTGWDVIYPYRGDGYNEEILHVQPQVIQYDSHEIATTNYNGYPGLNYDSPYGDLIPNFTMPNLVGMTTAEAAIALGNLGFTGNVTTNSNVEQGATAQNNGKIASQGPAAGALVNVDTAVIYNLYNYVAPTIYTTGPIAGFNRNSSTGTLNGNEAWMYLVGRTVRPAVGDSIAVTGSSDTEHNITWTVLEVINDDGYNTGGTAVKVHCLVAPLSDTSSGGTWTKI